MNKGTKLSVLLASLAVLVLSNTASASHRGIPDRFNYVLGRIACHSMGQRHDCRLNSFETDDLADGVQTHSISFPGRPW